MSDAFVGLEGTVLGTITDADGRYRLVNLPPGPQVLRAQRIGLATARLAITVPTQGDLVRDFTLGDEALEMSEITVTVDAVSRATAELATASVIDLDAIQHQTAASLAGVLELLPGVALQPPGLGSVQQFALRSAPTSGSSNRDGVGVFAQDLASFGTSIVLDGVPLSNNANLQSLGPRSEIFFTTSADGGIDLRRIPANTLERVEVIRGLPSARWGDLTQGTVIVDTRAGDVDPEIAGQLDPRTLEGTALGGRSFGGPGHSGTLTFDVAGTKITPGLAEDRSLRLAGQLSHRVAVGGTQAIGTSPADRKFTLDTRADVFRFREDKPDDVSTAFNLTERTDQWGIRISERARLRLAEGSVLSFTGSFATSSTDNEIQARKSLTGPSAFTRRLDGGREEGFFVLEPYVADVTIDGGPRLVYGRLELETRPDLFGLDHHVRVGLEPRREWSGGVGTSFDVGRPLQTQFNGVQGFDRPRSFDEISALVMSGYYVDDRLAIPLGDRAALQIQAGLRLDLLHEGSTWFDGVRDAFVQPRLNVEFSPVPRLRLRGGWGRVAKSPTVSALFPANQYYDVINVNQFTNDPAERIAVLTTFVEDPTNDDLGWIRATKAEVGIEFGVGGAEVSLVAFRDRIEDGVGIDPIRSFLLRDRFALSDTTIGNGIKPEILLPPVGADTIPILIDRPANVVEQVNKGIELVASLPEIRPIRTRLHVTGALVETEQTTNSLDYGPRTQFQNFQLLETQARAPFWDPILEFGRRALVTYRAIHHQPELGLVVTLTLQHNITDKTEDFGPADTLAFAGFIDRTGNVTRVPESERGKPEFQDLRVPRQGSLIRLRSTPGDWLAALQISKTLPLDGSLNFWAFNLTDRRGFTTEAGIRPRVFGALRFGLEVTLPLKALLPGRGG